jgi:O-antigen ligase
VSGRGPAFRRPICKGAGLEQTIWACAAPGASWLVLPVTDSGFDRYHLPKELFAHLVALLLLGLAWLRRERLGWDALTWLALSLGLVTVAATALATSPALALRGASLALSAIVLFLMARAQSSEQAARTRLWIVVAALGVAVLACAEVFGLVSQLSRAGRTPGASLGQRNMVAHLLALTAPSSFTLLARDAARTRRVLGALGSVLIAFVIVHTRSRAGWLALAGALVAFELLGGASRVRRGLPSALCALGVVLALAVPTQLAWRSSSPYRDSLVHLLDAEQGSGRGRLAQYHSSLGMLRGHPWLGVGPGNWLVHYPEVSPAGDPAFRGYTWLHTGRLINSDVLGLLVEQGPLALALVALLAFRLARGSFRTPDRALVCATLSAGFVAGALDAVLQLPSAVTCAALVLGGSALEPAPRVLSLRASRALGAALALPLSLAVALSAGRALGVWERTRPGGGYTAAERALHVSPSDLTARFTLAEAYVLEGDCRAARPHIAALRALLPFHEAPRAFERACRHSTWINPTLRGARSARGGPLAW